MDRTFLFLFVCFPARVLLAYFAKNIPSYYLPFFSLLTFVIGVQFIRHYIKNEPKIGFFGSNVWWENYRLIHGIDFLLFSVAAFFKNKNAWLFLLLDAILGLLFFIYEKYVIKIRMITNKYFTHEEFIK
jgi:hypothetical protein